MELVDLARSSYTPGATLALGKRSEEQESQRAEALQLGRGTETSDKIENKVREVAEDFVSVFMNQIMKSMRATVNQNEAMHGDNGEKFFQELLDTEQSKTLAQGSGYGLTTLIYESMMTNYRLQQMPQQQGLAGETNPQMDSLIQEQELLEPEEIAVG